MYIDISHHHLKTNNIDHISPKTFNTWSITRSCLLGSSGEPKHHVTKAPSWEAETLWRLSITIQSELKFIHFKIYNIRSNKKNSNITWIIWFDILVSWNCYLKRENKSFIQRHSPIRCYTTVQFTPIFKNWFSGQAENVIHTCRYVQNKSFYYVGAIVL